MLEVKNVNIIIVINYHILIIKMKLKDYIVLIIS